MEQNNIINLYVNTNTDYSDLHNIKNFIGFNPNTYIDPAIGGYGLVFITKPSLFLYPQKPQVTDRSYNLAYENMCKDPKFTAYINGENKNDLDITILKELSYFSFNDIPSLFLPIFTNMSKSLSTTDISLDTINAYQTKSGFSIPVPTTKNVSEAAGNLTLSVSETSNLDFIKMMSIWVEYISNITDGTFNANPEMIKNNMIDYSSSIYFFYLGPDRSIKYWCRYVSAFPTSIPYGALSYQKGSTGNIELDIPFQYAFKEDMDPRILEDFNMLSLGMVTPTFTNTSYNEFINETEQTITNGYSTYTQGSLLSKAKLSTGIFKNSFESAERDPLVLYKDPKESSTYIDNRIGRYFISFGSDSNSNKMYNSLVNDEDAFSNSIFND